MNTVVIIAILSGFIGYWIGRMCEVSKQLFDERILRAQAIIACDEQRKEREKRVERIIAQIGREAREDEE